MTAAFSRAEHWSLLASVAFLPLFEAPKNLAIFLYLLFWALNRWQRGDFGGSWSRLDSLIAALLATVLLSAQFAAFAPDKGLVAAGDALTYGLVLLTLRRSRIEATFAARLLAVAIVATLVALAHALWVHEIQGIGLFIELNSVGHVNHSALYLAIVFSLALAWATVAQRRSATRVLLWLAALLLWFGLFWSGARGAIIAAIAFILFWSIFKSRNRRRAAVRVGLIALGLGISGLLLSPVAKMKNELGLSTDTLTSHRFDLPRLALLAAREYPWLGVGLNNFAKITPERVAAWQAARGQPGNVAALHFTSHAHSLYFNTLAERGLLGLAALLAFLTGLALTLKEKRPARQAPPLEKALWGGAVGACWMAVGGGVFNTTLHHEHALISVIFIGTWLALKNQQAWQAGTLVQTR